MGKWVMASEETEGETVTFSVGLEGLMVLPGQVFAVSDAMRKEQDWEVEFCSIQ